MTYWISIKTHSPTTRCFMYMDAADEYHADSLFQKNTVHVKFLGREYISPDGRYRFVTCRIPKSEVGRFEKAMGELPTKMLLLGYEDYIDRWEKMMQYFEENRRK